MKRFFSISVFFLIFSFSLFSQWEEKFDAPPLSSRWTGDRERFGVLPSGMLFFDGSGKEGVFSLEAPVPYADCMEWEADVSLGFDPSNSNHLRLYVYATDRPADVLFYVQVGHNDDNVSLYEWRGANDPKRVISGRKKILAGDRSPVRVRLTMENGVLWRLYTRLSGEKSFTLEGEYRLPALPDRRTEGMLRIACHCKAASKKGVGFYIDRIRVSPAVTPLPDEPDEPGTDDPLPGPSEPPAGEAPSLETIEPLSFSEFQFLFDKPVYIGDAVFTVSGIGEAERVGYADATKQRVNALFPEAMEIGKTYTVSWSGLTDLEGRIVAEGRTEVVLEDDGTGGDDPDVPDIPAVYPSGALRITEVMADPNGLVQLPATEYVEVWNATETALPLRGWVFLYGGKAVPLGDLLLPAKGYVVLYRAGRTCTVDPGGQGMPLATFPAQLANAGKTLQLNDPSGNVIDRITYAEAEAGRAWERSGDRWHLSTDPRGGTPGAANSSPDGNPEEPGEPDTPPSDPDGEGEAAAPGDVVFNEVLPEPFPEGSEYIELYNRASVLLSLSDLAVAVRKLDGSLSTVYPLRGLPALEPDGYLALTKDREGVASLYLVASPAALQEVKLPVLSNAGATLVLFRPSDGTVIDEVAYSPKWHAPFVKNRQGVALERIDPAGPGAASNWTSASATAGYGTPGYRNSQSLTPDGDGPTGIQPPEYSDLTGEYTLLYRLEEAGYMCRAWVYDVAGRKVAVIADPALLGREGRLVWKGDGNDGSKLKPGMYIFYAELYHPSGAARSFKKVFLVHN